MLGVSPLVMPGWTFWEFDTPAKPIQLSTSMIKGDKTYFNAHVELHPKGMQPFMLAWQLIRFPVYCILIQIWIHYEAFWLFVCPLFHSK